MHTLFTTEELTLDVPEIYGISSALKTVKLGYYLLKNPYLGVERIEDISNYDKTSMHAAYEIIFLDDNYKCLLIKNRGTNSFFFNAYKNIDYLLCSLNEEEINNEIIEIVSKLHGVSICFALKKPNQNEILNFSQLL
jgi:hypothetical protein